MLRSLILVPCAIALLGAADPAPATAPQDAAAQIEIARGELAAGRPEAAIAAFREALRADPRNAIAHNALGSLFNQRGHYVEALKHAEAAVSADPGNRRYRYNRGVVLAEHGRFAAAIADFDEALTAHPDMAYAWLERGAALASLGSMAEARQSWAKARVADPKLVWVDWYWATGDMIEGRHAEAAAGFDRVARAESGFAAAQLWRMLAHAKAGNPIARPIAAGADWPGPILAFFRGEIGARRLLSIAATDRASGDERRIGEALFFIGQQHLLAGRKGEAAKNFRRARAVRAPRHVWKMLAEAEARAVDSLKRSRSST